MPTFSVKGTNALNSCAALKIISKKNIMDQLLMVLPIPGGILLSFFTKIYLFVTQSKTFFTLDKRCCVLFMMESN